MIKNNKLRAFDDESSDEEELDQVPPEEDKESAHSSITSGTRTRGRLRIPEQWSRVICLNTDDLDDLKVHLLAPDLLLANAMRSTATRGKAQAQWKPIYWPDIYVKEGHSMKVDENQLDESTLSKLAKKVTKFRKVQRERAVAATNDFGDDQAAAYLRTTEKLAR